MDRRCALRCAAGLALPASLLSLPGRALAQAYPSRPITLIVAVGPGGAGDIISRTVAQKMSENMGQPIVVENRPGAGAALAAVSVIKAKPDGHTLMLSGNGTAISAALFKTLPYDINRDFKHVSTLAFFDLALIVGGQSEFNTIADVLAFARANPGKLNIGTTRIGSTQHLAAEMFKAMAGIQAVCVPYRTTSEMITAVRSRDVQLAVEIVPPILGQIQARAIKVLAVAASRRFPGLPDVPTMIESGVPDFDAASWAGISVPAQTPVAIINRLAQEIERAVNSPQVQSSLQALGFVARSSTPEQATARINQDLAKWNAVIDKAGIPRQ